VIVAEVPRRVRRTPEWLLRPLRRRTVVRRLQRRPALRGILIVCHGNVCRSPYAAALLRRMLAASFDAAHVESAGFVLPGRPCPRWAVEVAAQRGVDLSGHRSRVVTPADVRSADLVVVMDASQRDLVRVLFGGDPVVLGELDPEASERRDIEDPVEQPKEAFERSYARIDRCMRALVDAMAVAATRRAPSDVTAV
jgi:protein-tyrosine phosphatase